MSEEKQTTVEQALAEEARRKITGMQTIMRECPWGLVEKLDRLVHGMKDKKDRKVFSIYGRLSPNFATNEGLKTPYLGVTLTIASGNNPVDVLKRVVNKIGGSFSRPDGGSDYVCWSWLARDKTEITQQVLRVSIYSGAPPSCRVISKEVVSKAPSSMFVDAEGRIMERRTENTLDCSNDLEVSE